MVGTTEDLELSQDFYDSAENMELLAAAAKGDEAAINKLGVAVGKDLVSNLEKSAEMADYVAAEFKKVNESGDDIDPSSFVGSINTALQNFDANKELVLAGLDNLQASLDSLGPGDSAYDILGGAD